MILFLSILFIVGCGGSNNSDPKINKPIDENDKVSLVSVQKISIVTTSQEEIEIDLRVIDSSNNPYKDGNVSIVYPSDVRTRPDIGVFAKSTVPVSNGHAKFTYKAPINLNADTSDIVFGFYHSDSPKILNYTIKIVAPQTPSIPSSYKLSIKSTDDDFIIPLEDNKLFSFFLKGDTNSLVEDSAMISLKVKILNPQLGILIDNKNNRGTVLTVNAKNSISMKVQTNTISGVIPLSVEAKFRDVNNQIKTINSVFNIVVLSGPPSAISLSYAGTSKEKEDDAKFVETWVLSVTDRYNNRVNTNPSVSMGMLAGYAQSSSPTPARENNFLYFSPSEGNGTINTVFNNFTAKAGVFAQVDQTNDYLVTFGNGYTYDASGKWSINTNSPSILDLVESYNGITTSELGFAVGNNQRQDRTREGVEWLGTVYPEAEGNYTIPNSGNMKISVEYDYYLVGKAVMLWVNLLGKNHKDDTIVRIGEAKKVTLRGNGIEADVDSIKVNKDANNTAHTFHIRISDTVEWYEHANFSAIPDSSEDVFINSVEYSDTSDQVAYVIIYATNTGDKVGSVKITDTLVTDEF